jgi:hypothetical protein
MTYEEMINLEKKQWDKYWEGPIPEPTNGFAGRPLSVKDLPWLGHIFWMNLSLGLTKKECKAGVRSWSKERLTEYCQRCMKVSDPLLSLMVEQTWAALGQIDARRKKAGYQSFYRQAEPDEELPRIVPRVGSKIVYEKNGITAGTCTVKEKYDKGWLGVSEDGTVVTGSDLDVVEIILLDWQG